MCHEMVRGSSLAPHMSGRTLNEMFGGLDIKPEFQWQNVQPGHCMKCNVPLSHEEMFPPHMCPRAMCQNCYNALVSGALNRNCIITNRLLEKQQWADQGRDPREVGNNIQQGLARDYYTLLACKVLGVDMSFMAETEEPKYREVTLPVQYFKQLAHHEPMQTVEEFFDYGDEPVEMEKVKVIRADSFNKQHRYQ